MVKREKKIVSLFVALVAFLSLFFLPQQTANVHASGVERPNVAITKLSVVHENGTTDNTFKYWETVKIDLAWDASMYRNTLKEGDYFTIKLPDGLRFGLNDSATHFNIVNRDNVVIANAEVTPTFTGGGVAKIVFTKAVEKKYNVTGELSLFAEFVFEKIKSGENNKFSVDVNGKITDTEVVVTKPAIHPDEVVTKWSARTSNPNEASWTMRLNYSKARTYTNVVLSDVLTAKSGSLKGIHYVDGSFILRRVEVNAAGDNIKELDRKDISNEVTFNADKTAFTYQMGTIDQNSQYYLDYKTTYVTNVILENKFSFVSNEFSKEVTAQYRDFDANGRGDGHDTGSLKLVKVDANNQQMRLPGATFKITEMSTQTEWTLTTDAQGEIELANLVAGQYKVEEISVPKGYVLDKTAKIVDLAQGEVKSIQITNVKEAPETGKIELIKTDVMKKELLAGAEFDVKDASGAVVAHLVTDAKGHAISKQLPLGKYTLVETKAPKGYVLNQTAETVNITKKDEVVKVEKTNKAESGKIIVSKFDKETKNRLSGMIFKIRHVESGIEKTIEMKENNVMEIEGLLLGKYEITEVTAPSGYDRDTTVYTVVLEKDGDEKRVDIFDTRQKETPKPPVVKEKTNKDTKVKPLPKTGAETTGHINDNTVLLIVSSVAVLVLGVVVYVRKSKNM